jgi:hypothetical protein
VDDRYPLRRGGAVTAPYVRTRGEVVDQLVEHRRAGDFRYLGAVAPGEYGVELDTATGPVRRQHDAAGTSAWLDGLAEGRQLVAGLAVLAVNAQVPEQVRWLLNCPSVLDQRRIRVAHAMERRGWTYADVAAHLHAQRSTVRDLLRYGRSPTRVTSKTRRLDEIEALLPELARGYGRKPGPIPNRARVAPLAAAGRLEPVELVRARALALAVEGGLVESWHPLDVTDLRAARVAQVADVLHVRHPVRVAGLIPWVRGLADGAVLGSTAWPPKAREQLSVLAHALA